MESLSNYPPCTVIVGVSGDLLEVARQLGREGERIGLMSRNTQLLYRYKELLEECGVQCQAYATDATQAQSVLNSVTNLSAWSPRVDRFIYNVGVLSAECDRSENANELARMMEASFLGFVNCFQLVHPMFKRLGHGHAVIMNDARTDGESTHAAIAGQSALRIYLKALRGELGNSAVTLSEVYLGRIALGTELRELSCEEVVEGVFEVLRTKPAEYTVGQRR